MPCYYPVTLYKSRQGKDPKTGRWPLTGWKDGYIDLKEKVPCGRCIGCRLERSRQWAVRCCNENQMHKDSAFITLTYRDDELVHGVHRPTLYPRHLQLFMKRLRKQHGKIRFFACGEYGTQTQRPHYHAIIYGYDWPDKKIYSQKHGQKYYESESLNKTWGHGNCIIGNVTFESAAYVARYIMDKKLGQTAKYYTEHAIEPEFVRMSRRPGIGATWYDKFNRDIFPGDTAVIRQGIKTGVPKYYSNKNEVDNPEEMKYIREQRHIKAVQNWREQTEQRLVTKEKVKISQINQLVRNTF